MGRVYLAHQESLDRPVALKLLPPHLAENRAGVERFLKEARSAGRLSHENIVAAVDVGEAGGQYYLVMEYVPGETLSSLIGREGPLPERRALDLAGQIARGLKHAHEHGFIHRDIKPSNILLTPDGVAKICDLGLVREVTPRDEAPEEPYGVTPAYASPEQCRHSRDLDPRTDLYSLGVTLFEMLTGRRPFTGRTPKELARQQVSQEPPDPRSQRASISPAAGALVLKLLKKDPRERYHDCDELLSAIEELRNPGAPRTMPVARRAARFRPGRSAVRWIPAAALAAALALVAGILISKLRSPSSAEVPRPGPGPDPEILQALQEAQAFEEAARGNPVRYADVKTRWRELERRFWSTPEHAVFRERLTAFEDFVCEEANRAEHRLVDEARALLREDRPLEALARLLSFPHGLAETPAALRLAALREDIRNQFVRRFREGLQTAADLAASGRFQEANRQVRQLRLILPPDGAGEGSELGKPYRAELEGRLRRLDEEESLARTHRGEALETGKGASVPAGVPEDGPAAAKVLSEPQKGPAPPITPLEALRRAILEGAPDQGEIARALLKSRLGASPVNRAADLLLARGLAAWNFTDPTRAAFLKYLSGLASEAPERLSPAGHRIQLSALADLVSGAKGKGTEALTLFACAHLESLIEAGETGDAAVAEAAGLRQGSVLAQWGPAPSVGRVELARLLVSPPGGALSRTGSQASSSSAFPERVLLLLCSTSEVLDASAAERWRKLGSGASEASWARMAEAVADRIRLSMSCEGCGGQGRAICPSCAASGTTACASCMGLGYTLDDDGGKVTCGACKGRGQVLCAACSGSKTIRCSSCDGKKMKAQLPGTLFRYLAELGLCEVCGGSGSYFARVLYPCPGCDGTGRSWTEIPKEFAKLPPWLKGQSGCACFNALRWLARHQSPDGSWAPAQWTSRCSEPGCEAAPASEYAVGVTSLALAAFLAAGVGPRSDLKLGGLVPAGELVRKSIGWLEAHQEASGLIRLGETDHSVLEHGMATWAMSMALLMTGPAGSPAAEVERANLRDSAQRAIRQTLALEQREGGWSAAPGGAVDTWATSWAALALLTARDAGLEVPRANLNAVLAWLAGVTDAGDLRVKLTPDQTDKLDLAGTESFSDHPTLSASGAFLRLVLEGKPAPGTLAAERFLERDLPSKEDNARDYSYWTWGTLFMAQRTQRRGALWTVWNGALFRELLPLQESRGTCALGSFPPSDRWGTIGGTVYATAMNAITLDVAIASKVLLKSR